MGTFLAVVGESISLLWIIQKAKRQQKFFAIVDYICFASYREGIWLRSHNNGRIILLYDGYSSNISGTNIHCRATPDWVKPKLRNLSTLSYCCHPWGSFIVGLSNHLVIVLTYGSKAVLILILTIMVSWIAAELLSWMKELECLRFCYNPQFSI